MTGVVVAWLLTILIPRLLVAEDPYDFHYYPIELTLVGLIYWITFAGYHRNKIIHIKPLKQVGPSLDPELAERCRTLLQESMAPQKMYLDPELTVGKVADHIKLPQKVVSAFINQHLNQSFNDYINHYRVEEVKARLLRNSDQHLTISGIAFDCGFNSQATFQRAFKNFAKQSPKEFLAQHAKKADLLAK
jgi:AraC-like DNA-binding protein